MCKKLHNFNGIDIGHQTIESWSEGGAKFSTDPCGHLCTAINASRISPIILLSSFSHPY